MATISQLSNGNVHVSIPLSFHTLSGRRHLSLYDPTRPVAHSRRNSLLHALAQAFAFREQLDDGTFSGIIELAQAYKMDFSFVKKRLRLTYLSPAIVTAIYRGRYPSCISLRKLLELRTDVWQEQHERLRLTNKFMSEEE